MFQADRPIQSANEDRLGRAGFAKALAEAFLTYEDKEGIVVGLYGDWGTGKTSVINMTLEHIGELQKSISPGQKPIVIKFNPWNFSQQDQLIGQFFACVSGTLRQSHYSDKLQEVGKRLLVYAKLLEPLRPIFKLAPWGDALLEGAKGLFEYLMHLGAPHPQDLEALKGELDDLLAKQLQKIIVVIDDIDRLTVVEVRQMFQLIKVLCDFPNTLYLLAFDRNVVEKALSRPGVCTGKEYVDKIVQVPFELPLVSKLDLEKVLGSQIDGVFRGLPEGNWDQGRYINVYYTCFKLFFRTLRDVNRYINVLRFGFPQVKDAVDPVDFLAITAIQVFLPELYYGIRDGQTAFAPDALASLDVTAEEGKKRRAELLKTVPPRLQDAVEKVLELLFPMSPTPESLADLRRNGRIGSPDVFDIYFGLSVPKHEISNSEMEAILSSASDSQTFERELLRLNKEGRIENFLDRLEDYTDEAIPEHHIWPIVTSLINLGDSFPEGERGLGVIDNPMRILRVCRQLTRRLRTQSARFDLFKHAIHLSKCLYTAVNQVVVLGQEHGKRSPDKPSPESERSVNSEQLAELENIARSKIEEWAESKRLRKTRRLNELLFAWSFWARKEKPAAFVRQMIETDEGLFSLLKSFQSVITEHPIGDYAVRSYRRAQLKGIAEFASLDDIATRLRAIAHSPRLDELDVADREAVSIFLDTYDGKIKEVP